MQCQFAIQQARYTSHALATLIALPVFVAATIQPDDRNTPAHQAVKEVIAGHAVALREKPLIEQASTLSSAMLAQDCTAITQVRGDISRNGFCQVARQGITGRAQAEEWAQGWCADAKSHALAASAYPDALNSHKAGVSPLEYAAISEISNYLSDTD